MDLEKITRTILGSILYKHKKDSAPQAPEWEGLGEGATASLLRKFVKLGNAKQAFCHNMTNCIQHLSYSTSTFIDILYLWMIFSSCELGLTTRDQCLKPFQGFQHCEHYDYCMSYTHCVCGWMTMTNRQWQWHCGSFFILNINRSKVDAMHASLWYMQMSASLWYKCTLV